VLASSAAVLLLAKNPHGGEHLKDLLVGQILWVNSAQLPLVSLVYAVALALWLALGPRLGRTGFYLIFACVVTISVQLVGLYLVFITLVVPALATWYSRGRRLLKGYLIGALGYVLGLVASLAADLPSGPMIVCAIAVLGLLVLALGPRRPSESAQADSRQSP
jgi:zinc/manganese transport system permease protein